MADLLQSAQAMLFSQGVEENRRLSVAQMVIPRAIITNQ